MYQSSIYQTLVNLSTYSCVDKQYERSRYTWGHDEFLEQLIDHGTKKFIFKPYFKSIWAYLIHLQRIYFLIKSKRLLLNIILNLY